MVEIPLQAVPNQSLTLQLDDNLYTLTIKTCGNVNSIDVMRDNETILSGERIIPGTPVFAYKYQEIGNFILITSDEDYPDYTQFGISQYLLYITEQEISDITNVGN